MTIQFEDTDGKIQKREFKGTHAEIHKQIMQQKDLPKDEREHLLRSLNQPQILPGIDPYSVTPNYRGDSPEFSDDF